MLVTAASGDGGYDGAGYGNASPWFPAASPYVVSVGGTALRKASSSRGWSEEVWTGSGSGCSSAEQKPAWQTDTGCPHRTDNDVAAVAAPETPVSVFLQGNWQLVGGTSAASPLVAGIEAHASAFAHTLPGADGFYSDPAARFDVTSGSNGECEIAYFCNAEAGYDAPTGVGSPNGALTLTALPPIAGTDSPTAVSGSGATLTGTVDPQGSETKYQFEYGHTTAYSKKTPEPPGSAGAGSERRSVTQTLSGLEANTVYHYRLVATNSRSETSDGEDTVFKTAAPTVSGVAPNVGSPNGGNQVTITGTNFVGVSAVKFGSQPATSVVVNSETSITANVPTEVAGNRTVDVTVTTPWGTTPTSAADHYTYERVLWSVTSLPIPSESATTELFGASCASSEYCVAVGRYQVPYTGYAEVWKTSKWSEQAIAKPAEGNESELWSASCTSATACTAVGDYDTKASSVKLPLAERWNGSEWSVQSVPAPSGAQETTLSGVSCPSASECFAVGHTKNSSGTVLPYAARWQNGTWVEQAVAIPPNSGAVTAFTSVSCGSGTFCMAVGYSNGEPGVIGSGVVLAERWSGSAWSIASPPNPSGASKAQITSVSCPTSNFCTAIGSALTSSWTSEIFRWTGSEWSTETTIPTPTGRQGGPAAVSCTSAQFCAAVGSYEVSPFHWVSLAETWNGTSWIVEQTLTRPGKYLGEPYTEGQGNQLNAVACSQASTCVAAGYLGIGAFGHQIAMTRGETLAPPTVTTGAAKATSYRTATLHGSITPNQWFTRYYFEYGPTTSYGAKAPAPDAKVSSETSAEEVQQTVLLPPGRTYHYRLVGHNEGSIAYGQDRTITMRSVSTVNGAPTLTSSIGSQGSGNGQLNGPQGAAIDSQNNLWVADGGNNRIEEFNEKGEYVSKFGSEGTGNGQFKGPKGPAIAPNGSLWVSDSGNGRIQKCSTTGECTSYGKGHLFEPTVLAVAPNGNVWVADPRYGRVEEFNEKGEFIREVTSVGDPAGVAVDAQGNVWVSNYTGNSVIELDGETGGTITQFGKSGSGNGTLNGPTAISVDANGDLWVVDDYNSARVQEFTPAGEYITHFGGGFYYPSALAVSSGFAYLEVGNSVQKWNIGAPTLTSSIGSQGSGNGQLNGPQGAAIDSQNNLWVADGGNNRIEEFNEKGEYVSKFGSEGTGNGQFKGPKGPAIAPNGSLWVSDSGNGRIQKCSTTGECTSYGKGHLFEPTVLAVAPNGNVWVADPRYGRVEEFNEKGEFIREVTSVGDPAGVAVDAQGNVWVSNYTGNSVIELDGETGGTITQFGKSGSGNGTLNGPTAISVDANGDLWVVDDYNSARVQEFTPAGEYITHFGGGFYYPSALAVSSGFAYLEVGNSVQKWNIGAPTLTSSIGSQGSGNGQLNGPQGAAIDSQNNLWVADGGNNRIEEFNEKGEYVSKFGSEGTGNGQFKGPKGPAIAPNGSLWVSDSGNGRIQKCSTTGECTSYGKGHLFEPTVLAVAPNGNVWVADPRYGRVEEFNEKGEFIREVTSVGDPAGVAVDAQGNVWVSNYTGNSVIELDGETGGTITQFGKSGSGNGTLNGPTAISVDANGDLWVVDDYNSARVQEFTPAGEYITHFGGGFYYPSALAVSSGFAYLALEDKVQKWAVVE